MNKKKLLLYALVTAGILYLLKRKASNSVLGDLAQNSNLSPLDISAKKDLSIGLMNLISAEEHSLFSYINTGNQEYLNTLMKLRPIRQRILESLVSSEPGAEKYCLSKHLLASAMRLYETGTKFLQTYNNQQEALEYLRAAKKLHELFLEINCNCKTCDTGVCYGG